VVASDLLEERQSGNYDTEEMAMFLDEDLHKVRKQWLNIIDCMPELRNHP
jgi:hypothetical protein